MKRNKILLLALFLSSYTLSHSVAQEQEADKPIYKIVSPEDQDNSFKMTFDKIDSSRFYNKAVLQILNKTTAKSSVVEVAVGNSIDVGQLNIKVGKCWQAPLDQKPDSRILLEISEKKSDNEITRIFFGWMISSSPSISSLEHPIYDVTALNCKK